jgi:hypothetical protein
MAQANQSNKRALIDRANSTVVAVVGIAAFIVVFSLVATKTLIGQAAYQNRVISAKRVAVNQLKSDITASGQLKTAYDAFISTPQNAIGGDPNGNNSGDGNNAKIVLDALPSSYDFPSLATSLESLLTSQNVTINSISGTDDELAQSANQSSGAPQPVPIPFQVSVTADYNGIQSVIGTFEKSIRPIQVQTIDISGSDANLTLAVTAQTYYQPAKSLNISEKVVK